MKRLLLPALLLSVAYPTSAPAAPSRLWTRISTALDQTVLATPHRGTLLDAPEQSVRDELIRIIEGDEWVVEWPGDAVVQEAWFAHHPEPGGPRVLNCDWGRYLMELDAPSWRTYWATEVARQLQANDDDGVFMDSLSVPNYLGADRYVPALLTKVLS